MTNTYLNLRGEIETLTFKEIKARSGKNISWEAMHEINKHKCDTLKGKEVYNLLEKYLGKVTVFNFNNAMEWGHVQIYPHYVELAIKNGAKDLRRL
jgi:hypothetical protein